MNRILLILIAGSLLSLSKEATAQSGLSPVKNPANPLAKNLIKLNLSAIPFQTYMIQYERVTGKSQSIALTLGMAPNVPLPFHQTLMNEFGKNADAARAIATSLFTKYKVTLEYRFYTGGRATKGFMSPPLSGI